MVAARLLRRNIVLCSAPGGGAASPLTAFLGKVRSVAGTSDVPEGGGRWSGPVKMLPYDAVAEIDRPRAMRRSGAMAVDHSIPILVVDDYRTMVRIIRNLLTQIGFSDVDDAVDGSEALQKLKQRNYGLIISDWNMEPMSGYELLRQVREDGRLTRTPFIMVTAESKTDNVIAAKQAGVNNYIVKPFNAATLKSKIDAVFGA